MKRISIFTTVLLAGISLCSLKAVTSPQAEKSEGVSLPDLIAQVAEEKQPDALDYYKIANGTMQVAEGIAQSGQRLPDSVIQDALDAVDVGEALSGNYPWQETREALQKLLEPPPEQSQDQNQDQLESEQGESDSQEGQNQSEEQQQGDSSEGDSGQQQEQQQQQSDSSQGEQGEQSDSGNPQGDQPQQGEDEANQESSNTSEQQNEGQSAESESPAKDGARMGEMEESPSNEEVSLDDGEELSQPPQEMQTLGGQQNSGQPIDAKKAAILQMLDQLKQQDEPGKIYQIFRQAEGGSQQENQPNGKDW